jgi:hypothetical protein
VRATVARLPARDLVPADGEADEVDAERVELRDAIFERAGPVEEPGVVLDAVTHGARGGRGCCSRERERCHGENDE